MYRGQLGLVVGDFRVLRCQLFAGRSIWGPDGPAYSSNGSQLEKQTPEQSVSMTDVPACHGGILNNREVFYPHSVRRSSCD